MRICPRWKKPRGMFQPRSSLMVMKSGIAQPGLESDMRNAARGPDTPRHEQASREKTADHALRSSGGPMDHVKAPVWANHTSLDRRTMGEQAVLQHGSLCKIAEGAKLRRGTNGAEKVATKGEEINIRGPSNLTPVASTSERARRKNLYDGAPLDNLTLS